MGQWVCLRRWAWICACAAGGRRPLKELPKALAELMTDVVILQMAIHWQIRDPSGGSQPASSEMPEKQREVNTRQVTESIICNNNKHCFIKFGFQLRMS